MSLSLVGTQRYPRAEELRCPGIDRNGTAILGPDDGHAPTRHSVVAIAPFNTSRGNTLREFNSTAADGVARLSWTLTLTDSRVVFTAPEIVGPYGGVKTRSGKMTAGQMKYEWLAQLVWQLDTVWLLTPMSRGGNQERVGIQWDEPLLTDLTGRVVTYWQRQGRNTDVLEQALVGFVAAAGEPGHEVDIDLSLKTTDEDFGPVAVAP